MGANEKKEATFHPGTEPTPSVAPFGGETRQSDHFRGRLPIPVADRLDALVERYESRILVQKATITRLVDEAHQSGLRERAWAEKVRELEAELEQLKRDTDGRGSW